MFNLIQILIIVTVPVVYEMLFLPNKRKHFNRFISVLLVMISGSCSKDEVINVSSCIQARIDDAKNFACPNSSINEYKFQHKIVFVIATGLCSPDAGADVLNINCDIVGVLWGFAGNKKINGVDFFENAKLIRTLWQN